jgi:hypothetical protein
MVSLALSGIFFLWIYFCLCKRGVEEGRVEKGGMGWVVKNLSANRL